MDHHLSVPEKRPHPKTREKQMADAYLAKIRDAQTPEELEAVGTISLQYEYGHKAMRLKAARMEAGRALCARHPLGYMLPKLVDGIVTLAGETFRLGKRPGSLNYHAMTDWAVRILQQHGMSRRDAVTLMDQWFDSPHRCIETLRRSIHERRAENPDHSKNPEELRAA